MHQAYAEEIYVLSGELTVLTKGRATVLRAGEKAVVPPGVAHRVVLFGRYGSRPNHCLAQRLCPPHQDPRRAGRSGQQARRRSRPGKSRPGHGRRRRRSAGRARLPNGGSEVVG
ncbi:hypothetical protein BXP70_24370 [Hymenobacter crusticola]|uniref:Cupin type-2 domain-containing protein n=1 Tax=Hymenobacter crusticola TaxID=1770526 RepID=A0A243W6Y5_9BACT|nr:hypothetical protein BXP70_24370 [Hymenobacter crusticola]